jgi:hypothetical protein
MFAYAKVALVILVLLVAKNAESAEPFVVYDSFSGNRIDAELWDGSRQPDPAILDFRREVRKGVLYLAGRSYGEATGTGATALTMLRLSLPESDVVSQLAADIGYVSADLSECAGGSGLVGIRIGGYFFNTGDEPPNPEEGALNDVFADVRIWRRAGSALANNVMEVTARAFRCLDAGCSSGDVLFEDSLSLGTVKRGRSAVISIVWEQEKDQFIFSRDCSLENIKKPGRKCRQAVYDFAESDDIAANHPSNFINKRLEILAKVDNCAGDKQPSGSMQATVDRFWVNAAAADR